MIKPGDKIVCTVCKKEGVERDMVYNAFHDKYYHKKCEKKWQKK